MKPERIVVTFEPDDVSADLGRPRYNIAPMQNVPVVLSRDDARVLTDCQWGFVPSWAEDPTIANRMINARSETAATKPSFRSAFRKHRCLIPADGFYEWQKTPDGKQPVYVRVGEGELFAFAGLYSQWRDPESRNELLSCTILTTEPNELMRTIHHRMPVILPPEHWGKWLSPENGDTVSLQELLRAFSEDRMKAYNVGKIVNSPANDDERCIAEVS